MKNLFIVIYILITVLLVGCRSKGVYVGELKDGEPLDYGTFIYRWGTKYVGELKDGEPHGQGTQTFSDGTTYVGELKDGIEHGQATLTHPDGSKYVGEYKDGGEWNGTWYDKDGKIDAKVLNGKYIEQ